jgi:hypothetical protein
VNCVACDPPTEAEDGETDTVIMAAGGGSFGGLKAEVAPQPATPSIEKTLNLKRSLGLYLAMTGMA